MLKKTQDCISLGLFYEKKSNYSNISFFWNTFTKILIFRNMKYFLQKYNYFEYVCTCLLVHNLF